MFEVNFFSGVELLRKAAMRLIELGSPGHLLMCASCLARFSLPLHGAYCATKAAQNQICWAMRGELKKHNIEVSSVLPVTTTTEFFEVSARNGGRKAEPGHVPDHAPRFLTQPPQRVAQAVVRCLRKPKPEVWTSHTVRFMAGLMTMFPSLAERIGREHLRRVT
jgi:short-subunit dehydrogenase